MNQQKPHTLQTLLEDNNLLTELVTYYYIYTTITDLTTALSTPLTSHLIPMTSLLPLFKKEQQRLEQQYNFSYHTIQLLEILHTNHVHPILTNKLPRQLAI